MANDKKITRGPLVPNPDLQKQTGSKDTTVKGTGVPTKRG